MSSTTRATAKGGKSVKKETNATTKTHKIEKGDTPHKTDKNKSGKGSGDKNHHQSQQNSDSAKRTEDSVINEAVLLVMEMTRRSEEDACFALHESGFDSNLAVNMLIESADPEWVTSVKKKKNRQPAGGTGTGGTGTTGSTNKTDGTAAETNADEEAPPVQMTNNTERTRNRGGGSQRSRGRGSWRGRENRENEKNMEFDFPRRGGRMSNGPIRGGGSGRGGRGGGRSRTFQSRDGPRNKFTRTMDTWNSNTMTGGGGGGANFDSSENWETTNNEFPTQIDDWYNEEYTGSLTETKVFTPSSIAEQAEEALVVDDNIQDTLQEVPSVATQSLDELMIQQQQQQQQQQSVVTVPQSQSIPPQVQSGQVPEGGFGSLTAAQSQYLSQLTQQTSESVKVQQQQQNQLQAQYNTSPVNTYNSTSYAGVGTYGNIQEHSGVQQSLPARTKTQRARVPPPSKIPSSAVEMPGDLNSSVGYLDVQFGALDFMDSGNTFDNVTTADKYSSTNSTTMVDNSTSAPNLDLSSVNQSAPTLDSYGNNTGPKQTQTQSSISSALSQGQMLTSGDSISQTAGEHMSSSVSGGSYAQSRSTVPVAVPAVSALDIGKATDVAHSYAAQQQANSYPSYQSQKATSSVYQTQNYNTNSYQPVSQVTSTSSYVSSPPTNSYANSNTAATYNPSVAAVNSYQNNSYSGTASPYQTGTVVYPSITQTAASYPTGVTTYQPSGTGQSVYGTSSNQYNNQYNSYNTSSSSTSNASQHNHKISTGKEYEGSTTANAAVTTSSSVVNASQALSLNNSSNNNSNQITTNTASGTKVSSSSVAAAAAAAAKSGVVANIAPGVAAPAAMMSAQYIMGQTGIPFYQQPVYSYDELQMLQQRVPPHLVSSGAYYDIGYQTPTTLATGREGSIASGAYSTMSDSRYTRSDNNASPVPSTLSQQTSTQSHQAQPMLSATLPPGYAYFYNASMMPGSFQYGTPAIYPQMPAATNAHGSTNLNQYPKPSNYGSGYGSGYDTLTQSQDYAKSGYVGGTQTQSKGAGVGANAVTTGSSAASDLSVMYGKSHAALGKVNSYEKQGFHSGTPPPFNMAGNQNAGMAPNATYGPQMYIPTMQHHNTTLMHQPLHQMEMRHQARRMDSGNSSGQRSQSSSQAKSGAKQTYPNSYWNPA